MNLSDSLEVVAKIIGGGALFTVCAIGAVAVLIEMDGRRVRRQSAARRAERGQS